jgi:sulfur relay (sulfurtransferase) complex TusBCD TusD component (DsrE family)
MRLGFLLATKEDADVKLVDRLTHAALAGGHEVRIFLMHDGVEVDLSALVEAGADVVACGTNAEAHGVDLHVTEGSQMDHAALVRDCDRVVSLA